MAFKYLSSDDFTVAGNPATLCPQISGLSLVLYYSYRCPVCTSLLPIFKELPKMVNGCQFALFDASRNMAIVQLSASTTTPLTYVPMVYLYFNGRPISEYNGPADPQAIRQFIFECATQLNKYEFMKSYKKHIPSYTIGQPLCGEDERHYLEMQTAYQPGQRQRGR